MAQHPGPRCACGCGQQPKRGRFLPGHDSKLRSQVITSIKTGRKVTVYRKRYDPIEFARSQHLHLTPIDVQALRSAGVPARTVASLTRRRRPQAA